MIDYEHETLEDEIEDAAYAELDELFADFKMLTAARRARNNRAVTEYAGVDSRTQPAPVQWQIGAHLIYVYKSIRCYARVDTITARGTWIACVDMESGKHCYQLLKSTDEVYAVPSWLLFPAFDEDMIAKMRGDQMSPERDEEFVRLDYSGVTK